MIVIDNIKTRLCRREHTKGDLNSLDPNLPAQIFEDLLNILRSMWQVNQAGGFENVLLDPIFLLVCVEVFFLKSNPEQVQYDT